MALLEKFNDWYVKSIPETGPGLSVNWQEPAAGSRYRWKTGRTNRLLGLAVCFTVAVISALFNRSNTPIRWELVLIIPTAMTAVWALISWGTRNVGMPVMVTKDMLFIGAGRGMRRIHLSERQVTLDNFEGHRVLLATDRFGKPEMVFLNPAQEPEIRALLAQGGHFGKVEVLVTPVTAPQPRTLNDEARYPQHDLF